MQRVQLRTTYAGPRGTFAPGAEIECSDEEAKALIAGRFATAVVPPQTIVTQSLGADGAPATSLDKLDIKPSVRAILVENDVTTVEELRLIKDVTTIPGIGAASAAQIASALATFK